MTYKETVDFLFEQLPQFQNIGGKAYNGKLDNIQSSINVLNNKVGRTSSTKIF